MGVGRRPGLIGRARIRGLAPAVVVAIVALVALAVLLSVGAWILLRAGGARDAELKARRAADRGSAASDATPAAPEAAAQRSETEERRAAAGDPERADDDDPNARFRGTSSVRLIVVDAQTEEPLTDLPFVCWSERPYVHVYARGLTDAKGSAELDGLPEDVVVFETARRPPYANTVFAAWLPAASQREVVMRVGRGGRIVGRALDDLGHPLEGVLVRFDTRPAQESMSEMKTVLAESAVIAQRFQRKYEVMATTGADGRFRAEALLSRYGAIWITNHAPDPRSEVPIGIQLRWREARMERRTLVHEGETADLGDVVFERARTYAGRVVEGDGTPVAGALVSTSWARYVALSNRPLDETPSARTRQRIADLDEDGFDAALRPGEAAFKLGDEEVLTDENGAFEVVSSASSQATVATADGRVQRFNWPDAAPGSRTGGLEFKLQRWSVLALTLTEPGGAPIRPDDGRFIIVAAAGTRHEELRAFQVVAGEPGRYDARWSIRLPDTIGGLVVDAPGYQRRRLEWHPTAGGRDALALALTPVERHVLELELKLHDPAEAKTLRGTDLRVTACLLAPDRHLGRRATDPVCGLEAYASVRPRAVMPLDVDVANQRTWNIYVQGPFDPASKSIAPLFVGAFAPDGVRHSIELPAVSPAWLEAQAQAQAQTATNAETGPATAPAAPAWATVTLTAIDARSDAPIRQRLTLQSGTAERSWVFSGTGDEGGAAQITVYAGHAVATLRSEGYRPSSPLEFTVATGGTVDLGSVRLEPLPVHRLRLVEPSGAPSRTRVVTLVRPDGEHAPGPWFSSGDIARALGDGLFELRGELPEQVEIRVGYDGSPAFQNVRASFSQRFELAAWPPEEVPELKLARWHEVVVDVDLATVSSDLWGAEFQFELARAGDPAAERAPRTDWRAESRDVDADRRRYRYVLPSGDWVARGSCALFAIPDTSLPITDEQEDVAITIAAH